MFSLNFRLTIFHASSTMIEDQQFDHFGIFANTDLQKSSSKNPKKK